MNSLQLLEKRQHVLKYQTDIHPSKKTIKNVLWKAWKVTPSKQKMMPYSIFVLGPEESFYKSVVYENVIQNHANSEYRAAEMGKKDASDYLKDRNEFDKKFYASPNKDYFHVKENSYLIIITSRVVEKTNEYNERQIYNTKTRSDSKFHARTFFDQMHESHVNKISDSVCVEIGMFTQNLTTFCLEEKIDISYTSCLLRDLKGWTSCPFIRYTPRLVISLGHGQVYRSRDNDNLKPEPGEIIEWI